MNAQQFTVPLEGSVEGWGIEGLKGGRVRELFERVYGKVGFRVQRRGVRQMYAEAYVKAGVKAGLGRERDGREDVFRGDVRDGVWQNRVAVGVDGRRRDAYTAYVAGVRGMCRNLWIVEGVTVGKIEVKEGVVTGVEVFEREVKEVSAEKLKKEKEKLRKEKRKEKKKAKKAKEEKVIEPKYKKHFVDLHQDGEILLCAGAYESPKILQLSGIGPKDVLDSIKVKTLINLPVGVDTQARASIRVTSSYSQDKQLERANDAQFVHSSSELRKFEAGKGGVLATTVGMANGIVGRAGYLAATSVFSSKSRGLGMRRFASVAVGNPTCKGWVRAASKDAVQVPDVQLSLLCEQRDLARLMRVAQTAGRVHENFERSMMVREVSPVGGIGVQYVKANVRHAYHFCGGCAVGRVVDDRLRVFGVAGLRVVDASVMSDMPRGAGPMASVYVVAEHAADMMRPGGEWA